MSLTGIIDLSNLGPPVCPTACFPGRTNCSSGCCACDQNGNPISRTPSSTFTCPSGTIMSSDGLFCQPVVVAPLPTILPGNESHRTFAPITVTDSVTKSQSSPAPPVSLLQSTDSVIESQSSPAPPVSLLQSTDSVIESQSSPAPAPVSQTSNPENYFIWIGIGGGLLLLIIALIAYMVTRH
jgi:hypothetical protein